MYRMWNNKCLTETYEPGSTFKVVTSSMALEEGVVTPESPFYCAGSLMVDGWSKPISCANHNGHGAVTIPHRSTTVVQPYSHAGGGAYRT